MRGADTPCSPWPAVPRTQLRDPPPSLSPPLKNAITNLTRDPTSSFVAGVSRAPPHAGTNAPSMAMILPPHPALSSRTHLPLEWWSTHPSDIPEQVGGHLSLFHKQWSALGTSPGVMQSISGLKLETLGPPSGSALTSALSSNRKLRL